jgi:hypothetical protein
LILYPIIFFVLISYIKSIRPNMLWCYECEYKINVGKVSNNIVQKQIAY